MRVLVTGANGFLGSHIVARLLLCGYDVRAFVLRNTSIETIQDLQCEIFEGNLLDDHDIKTALVDCDYLIHTAAVTDVWPTKNPISWKINYELVKQIAIHVREAKLKKYIHVGTANSFGYGSKEKPGTESTSFNSGAYGLDYIESKKVAQNFLLEEANKEDPLPVVIINPTFMIGPNDTKPGPGEMIISVIKGKVPGYSRGGRSFASVKHVAEACVAALEKGKIGECYITGGTNLSYKEFFTLIAYTAGVKAPKRLVPTWLALLFAGLTESMANMRHKKPLLTKTMAKISGAGHYYASEKAKRELDYDPSGIEVALEEAIAWYNEHGYLNEGKNE